MKMTKNNKVIVWGGFGEKNSNSNTQWYQQHRIYDVNGISPALSTYKADLWIAYEEEDGKQDTDREKIF